MTSLALALPSPLPVFRSALRNLVGAGRSPLDFFSAGVAEAGELYRTRIGTFETMVVVQPSAVEEVLKTKAECFAKDANTRGMRWLLGDGMLTTDGDVWAAGRRSAARDFTPGAFAGLMRSLQARTAVRTAPWVAGGAVDISAVMADLSLELICDHLFGPGVTGPQHPLLVECLRAWAGFFEVPFHYFVLRSPWPPLPYYARIRRVTRELDAWFEERIREARAREVATTPFERICKAPGLSVKAVRDQVITLILTGHETTANAMSWTLRFLAETPDVQAELRAALPPLGDDPMQDLERMKSRALPGLLEAVALEGVRLRPPAWCMGREVAADVEIAGHALRRGAHVTLPVAVIHTQERWFEDAQTFAPRRWLDSSWRSALHRFAFVPFGGGPHLCLGQNMAMLEVQWLLWRIVRQFELSAGGVERPRQVASISLRPDRPIVLSVAPVARS